MCVCVFYQSVIPGKNIGYDVYKEIKGEEDFHRKMKEADKVKAVLCACELLVQARSLPCRPGRSEDGIRKITFLSHPYPIFLFQPHSYSPERFWSLPRLLPSLNIKTGSTSSKKKNRLLGKLRFHRAMKGAGEFFARPNKCARETAECIKMLQMPCNSFISGFF